MPDQMDAGSIASELDKRLDSLFGEDESEKLGLVGEGSSPLAELKVLMLTIDWEISDETLMAFNQEVEQVKRLYVGDPYVPLLLKMLSSLTGYLKAKKAQAHPKTLQVLNSIFGALEKVVESRGLSPQEKKALVDREIEGFKELKSQIVAGVSPSPDRAGSPEKTSSTLREAQTREVAEEKPVAQSAVPGEPREFSPGHLSRSLEELKGYLRTELATLQQELAGLRQVLEKLQQHLGGLPAEMGRYGQHLEEIKASLAGMSGMLEQRPGVPSAQVPSSLPGKQESPQGKEAESGSAGKTESEQPQPDFQQTEDKEDESLMLEEEDSLGEKPAFSAFFAFQLGGRNYAVAEDYVIKACRLKPKMAKKAKSRGHVRMMDFRAPFTSIKRGVLPAWKHLSGKELKQTQFPLLQDGKLPGLEQSPAGGLLFLGCDHRRGALITDYLPLPVRVDEGIEFKPSPTQAATLGILVVGEGEEQETYTVVDVESLLE